MKRMLCLLLGWAIVALCSGCLRTSDDLVYLGKIEKIDEQYVFRFCPEIDRSDWAMYFVIGSDKNVVEAPGGIEIQIKNLSGETFYATSQDALSEHLPVGMKRIAFNGGFSEVLSRRKPIVVERIPEEKIDVEFYIKISGGFRDDEFPVSVFMIYEPKPF